MEKENKKPIISFEPGSRQPFVLYLISITIVTSVIVIICLFTGGLSVKKETVDTPVKGDINQNGTVDSGDALMLSNYLIGQGKLSESQLAVSDIDGNGTIDSNDSRLILQSISNIVPSTTAPVQNQDASDPSDESVDTDTTETDDTTEADETTQPLINAEFNMSGKADNAAFITSQGKVYYIARVVNSWQAADSKYMYQIELTLKNNSDKTVYNTYADITFGNDVTVEKEWDCTTETQANVIKLKTKNNGSIKKGGSFKCGFIISSGSPVEINSVTK